MNNLTEIQQNLPATIEDLSKFVLVGREKINAVKAEIRAIDKLQLAEEVRAQKMEEVRMLSEAVLDATVKVGDLLKKIPKNSGGDRRSENFKIRNATEFEKVENAGDSKKSDDFRVYKNTEKPKTKKEVIEKLGFSEDQAHRFEILADNKNIVEQVKTEARENNDLPTQTRILNIVDYQKKKESEENNKFWYGDKKHKELDKIVAQISKLKFSQEDFDALAHWHEDMDNEIDDTIDDIRGAIQILQNINFKLMGMRGKFNVKKRY